jgi:CBS domain-containing protein
MLDSIWDTVTVQEVLDAKPHVLKKSFIAVTEDEPLNSCLEKMLKHKVSSLPVMKLSKGEDDKPWANCVGIVDVKDVLQFLIKELEYIEGWTCWAPLEFKTLMQEVLVRDVIDLAHGDPLVMAHANSFLRSVVKFFAGGVSHRCVIHMQDNDFAILSQVDIMHYLAKRISEEDDMLRAFLENIPLTEKLSNRGTDSSVITAKLGDSVMSILKKMYSNDVSAVAIVDEQGKLHANFSTSDVLHFEFGMLSDLNLPVADFLKKYASWAFTPLAVQKEDGSLADAVVLFSALAIHRVWLVDSSVYESFAPVGVVTLTDMFSMLTKL